MRAFEYRGVWWLPDCPDDKVAGDLRFAPESGLVLDLFGELGGDTHQPFGNGGQTRPLIVGVTQPSNSVCLFDSFLSASTVAIPGIITQQYRPLRAYFGVDLDDLPDDQFSAVELRLTDLDAWAPATGFSAEERRKPRGELELYDLTYRLPDALTADTPIGRVSLEYGFVRPVAGRHHVNLRQEAKFRVDLRAPATLNEICTSVIRPLQSLVSLGSGTWNNIEALRVHSHSKAAGPREPVEVVFQEIERGRTDVALPHRMLFDGGDIASGFEQILGDWFTASRRYSWSQQVFFGSFFDRQPFVEQRLMNLARAAEGYHRGKYGASDADHMDRVAAVLASTDEIHREWLAERLKHGDEPSLRSRLRDLLRLHRSAFVGLDNKHLVAIANRVVEVRNHVAHLSSDLVGVDVGPAEVHALAEAMGFLLTACWMSELGFSESRIGQLFGAHQRYALCAARIRDHLHGKRPRPGRPESERSPRGNLWEEISVKRDQILRIADRHGVRKVRVFGSVSTGRTHRQSDVDFLVDVDPGRTLFDLGGFVMELRALLGRPVDVTIERSLKEPAREKVLSEAVSL